jgi:protein-tyrosine phosphatase
MIDLHCHILPGLDDGPATMEDSLAMARVAAGAGITTIVATPHIREDHPFDPDEIPARVAELNGELAARDIRLEVLPGGEVSLSRVPLLDDSQLGRLALGGSRHLLVESPYSRAVPGLEDAIFALQVRGFKPVLAHPERCPIFRSDPDRLQELVQRGVLCSITAASLAGGFGDRVRSFTASLLARGLVHDVASDSHGPRKREPVLMPAFEAAGQDLPGIGDQAWWYAEAAPRAMLSDEPLPPRPAPPPLRGRRRLPLGRLLRRERL